MKFGWTAIMKNNEVAMATYGLGQFYLGTTRGTIETDPDRAC